MTCQCNDRGFCPRRNAYVPRPQWRLCQAGHEESVDKVIKDLEIVRLKYKKDRRSKALKKKIRKRVEQRHRIKKWVSFFRTSTERGLGDTVFRLSQTSKNNSKMELYEILIEILKECSCTITKAIEHLNNAHPYTDNN